MAISHTIVAASVREIAVDAREGTAGWTTRRRRLGCRLMTLRGRSRSAGELVSAIGGKKFLCETDDGKPLAPSQFYKGVVRQRSCCTTFHALSTSSSVFWRILRWLTRTEKKALLNEESMKALRKGFRRTFGGRGQLHYKASIWGFRRKWDFSLSASTAYWFSSAILKTSPAFCFLWMVQKDPPIQ